MPSVQYFVQSKEHIPFQERPDLQKKDLRTAPWPDSGILNRIKKSKSINAVFQIFDFGGYAL